MLGLVAEETRIPSPFSSQSASMLAGEPEQKRFTSVAHEVTAAMVLLCFPVGASSSLVCCVCGPWLIGL